jgi:hypothetical protein
MNMTIFRPKILANWQILNNICFGFLRKVVLLIVAPVLLRLFRELKGATPRAGR